MSVPYRLIPSLFLPLPCLSFPLHGSSPRKQLTHTQALQQDPNPLFLDFLRIVCTCDGEPLPHNQNLIVRLLLENPTVERCDPCVYD
jgi:hypothetical protein